MTPGDQPQTQSNTQQLLQQVQQMQHDLLALTSTQVEGTAGGGLVTATVTGAGELVGLTIDPKAVDPADTETLADLVLAAVRDANRAVEELRAETMGRLTQGLGGLTGPGGLAGFRGLTGPGGLAGFSGLTGPGGPAGLGDLAGPGELAGPGDLGGQEGLAGPGGAPGLPGR